MRTCRHCKTRYDETQKPLRSCPSKAEGPCEGVPRGFATMSKERLQEISAKGGQKAHVLGHAHRFNAEEARTAGALGGRAPHVKRGPDPGTPAPVRRSG